MTISDKIRNRINEICTHFTFTYHGKSCGVDPYSKNDFEMWCGDSDFRAKNIDEVMNHPLFDGKSLTEIAEDIEIIEW